MVWDVGDHLIDRIYRELTGEQFCTISKNSNFHAVVVIWAKRIKNFYFKGMGYPVVYITLLLLLHTDFFYKLENFS